MSTRAVLLACLGTIAGIMPAHADDNVPGHWTARIGVHPVDPKPNNHSELTIDNAAGLSLGATYLLSKHWAVEWFSAFPPAHEIHAADGTRIARFTMVPSSATLQYRVGDDRGIFGAYGGVGLAYARIGGEQTKASLSNRTLELDDSIGIAATIGLNVNLDSNWFLTADIRWMDIDSSLRIDGVSQGALEIDPYLFGLSVGRQFR